MGTAWLVYVVTSLSDASFKPGVSATAKMETMSFSSDNEAFKIFQKESCKQDRTPEMGEGFAFEGDLSFIVVGSYFQSAVKEWREQVRFLSVKAERPPM